MSLADFQRRTLKRWQTAARRAALITEQKIKSDAPVATGNLRNSISVTRQSDFEWLAKAEADYASFVEDGTRAHVIYPRGNVLVFYWPVTGRTMFLKKVNHPGTRAQPFFGSSRGNTDRLERTWHDALEQALGEQE